MNYWLSFDTNKMQKLIRLRQKQRKYIRIVDFFDKTRFIFSSTSNYYKALKRGTLSKNKLMIFMSECRKLWL